MFYKWPIYFSVMIILFVEIIQPAKAIEQKGKTSLGHQNRPYNPSKETFYFKVVGDFFPKNVLMKGDRRIESFLSKYSVKEHVEAQNQAYEMALKHNKAANYANFSFYSMTSGLALATYGVLDDRSSFTSIGALLALISIGPYIYYSNKSFKYLNETINIYNKNLLEDSFTVRWPKDLYLSHTWSY